MPQIPHPTVKPHHADMMLEAFDLNLLRALDALLVTRSVSGAARRLNLSQPATSAALARLRDALGDPLLIRKGNSLLATPLAEELRPRVMRIMEDIGDALGISASFDPATTQRRFRIGANDYSTLVLLAPLAQRLRQRAPLATLEILPINAAPDLALANRELDLVVADNHRLRELRELRVLFHEEFVCIARADHPRLSAKPTLEEFLNEDHALLSTRGVSPGAVDAALEPIGRTRRVALTLPHFIVAPFVIAQSDLVMTLPSRVVGCFGNESGLRVFAPPLPVNGFDMVMAWHARSAADPPVQWLKSLLSEIAAEVARPAAT